MAISKRMVCLANSRKLQGRCIAGRELDNGKPIGWIRPIGDRTHEEVTEYERQYEDGSDPRVLDVIDVFYWSRGPRITNKRIGYWIPTHIGQKSAVSLGQIYIFLQILPVLYG